MGAIEKFDLKEEHLVLLGAASVRWEDSETGAPSIDCKRPYGNSGDIAQLVMEVLDVEVERCPHCEEVIGKADLAKYEELHRGTEAAMSVILSRAGDATLPGTYVREKYSHSRWELE